jgi:hypothetical protein
MTTTSQAEALHELKRQAAGDVVDGNGVLLCEALRLAVIAAEQELTPLEHAVAVGFLDALCERLGSMVTGIVTAPAATADRAIGARVLEHIASGGTARLKGR